MVGLVFIDWLRLTPAQWLAVIGNTAGWLWWSRPSPGPAARPDPFRWGLVVGLTWGGLWLAFWHEAVCTDTWMLFESAVRLKSASWTALLDQLPDRMYVRHQPPFLTYVIARLPVLWAQQLRWLPWALLCAGLLFRLYGRNAALLLATPVTALMLHQPSYDLLLFGTLLIVLRLLQLRQRTLAAVVYGLTWMMKPLTILTAPFMLPRLGAAGLLSLGMWGGYVIWSLQWEFGQQQAGFVLQQLFIKVGSASHSSGEAGGGHTASLWPNLQRTIATLSGTFRWRWAHLGRKAVVALPFYLFPAYARPWRRQGIALTALIVLGYGNIKYLLLALLFVFPVQEEPSART
jgi:hypothetical protein